MNVGLAQPTMKITARAVWLPPIFRQPMSQGNVAGAQHLWCHAGTFAANSTLPAICRQTLEDLQKARSAE